MGVKFWAAMVEVIPARIVSMSDARTYEFTPSVAYSQGFTTTLP